jgi:sterol desaturase/sphingolipid hydroxylase (fatty acid hydroxylase superfamily)
MLTAAPIQYLLGFALVKTIHWESINHIGLFYEVQCFSNDWVQLIFTFIFLDFFEYVYHIIMHKIKRLWMFHLVHHCDRIVDTSTVLREHPGETFFRLSLTTFWVFLLGASFWAVLFRQFIQIASNVFVHSNFKLSKRVDRIVGFVFITPTIHRIHHHFKQPYTDNNYGDVLSVWDRIFGTFGRLKEGEINCGVDSSMDTKENANFIRLLKMPFGKYRPPVS